MQSKRLIWSIAAVLSVAALAGCATPEEATDDGVDDNLTDDNATDGDENATAGNETEPGEEDADVPPPSNRTTSNETGVPIEELVDENESESDETVA